MANYGATYVATLPDLEDVANIVTAFQEYHDDIESFFALKANLAAPTFTGTMTAASITASGTIIGNLNASSTSNGKVTINNTSTTAPGTYTTVGRIFVQSTQPNANVSQTGDLWMW